MALDDPDKRFYEKVRIDGPGGCHLWTGARNIWGYGRLKRDGVMYAAHRVAWELANGPIPDGRCVLHRCDVRACVNPAHLFLGTQLENVQDMHAKGRHPQSNKRFDARLNINLPAELRTELEAAAKQAGELMSDVARRVLVEWATSRVVARGGPAVSGIAVGNGQDSQTKTERL